MSLWFVSKYIVLVVERLNCWFVFGNQQKCVHFEALLQAQCASCQVLSTEWVRAKRTRHDESLLSLGDLRVTSVMRTLVRFLLTR
jgi:hypothetical protein